MLLTPLQPIDQPFDLDHLNNKQSDQTALGMLAIVVGGCVPGIREIHQGYILNTLEYTQIHSNTPKYSMCSRGSYRVFAVFRCILMYSHMYSAA